VGTTLTNLKCLEGYVWQGPHFGTRFSASLWNAPDHHDHHHHQQPHLFDIIIIIIIIITIIITITITIIIIIIIMNYQEAGRSSGFCCSASLWISWGWLDSLLCPLSCLAVLLARVSFLALHCAGASRAVLF